MEESNLFKTFFCFKKMRIPSATRKHFFVLKFCSFLAGVLDLYILIEMEDSGRNYFVEIVIVGFGNVENFVGEEMFEDVPFNQNDDAPVDRNDEIEIEILLDDKQIQYLKFIEGKAAHLKLVSEEAEAKLKAKEKVGFEKHYATVLKKRIVRQKLRVNEPAEKIRVRLDADKVYREKKKVDVASNAVELEKQKLLRSQRNKKYIDQKKDKKLESLRNLPIESLKVTIDDELFPSAAQLLDFEHDPVKAVWMFHAQSGTQTSANFERMGDYKSYHKMNKYIEMRSEASGTTEFHNAMMKRVETMKTFMSHSQKMLMCSCCGRSKLLNEKITEYDVNLNERLKKSEYRPNTCIPSDYHVLRNLDCLQLEDINFMNYLTDNVLYMDATDKGWTREFHVEHQTDDVYMSIFRERFDSKLYMGNSEISKLYRREFHYRNIFIDIVEEKDYDNGENSIKGYRASAYFVIPCMVKFYDSTCNEFYSHEELSINHPTKYMKLIPYAPFFDKDLDCLLKGQRNRKIRQYPFALKNGCDVGCLEDVADVYNLFPDELILTKDEATHVRYKKLEPLSLLEMEMLVAVHVVAHIVKIVAFSNDNVRTFIPTLRGHIISMKSEYTTRAADELKFDSQLNLQSVVDNTQVY